MAVESGWPDAPVLDPVRFVPGPHSAEKLAAMDGALLSAPRSGAATRARVMTGAAVLALAVVLPDLSLGAMGAPSSRIEIEAKDPQIMPQVWTPAFRAPDPEYISAAIFAQATRDAQTPAARPSADAFDRVMPISVLESGSERFDLAFAGSFAAVELPAERLGISAVGLPGRAVAQKRVAPALRTRTTEIAQIANLPAIRRPLPADAAPGKAAATQSMLTAASPVSRGMSASALVDLASSGAALEAAFASPLDISGGMRNAPPVDLEPLPMPTPAPTRAPTARAVPIPAPAPNVGAQAARETMLIAKTRLDARVNGVLTGKVDFRQQGGTIAIKLRSVVEILRDRFSASEFDALVAGQSADRFIPLAELQAAGIPIRYNAAYDEVEFGIDYKDAPNAAKVQVEQIGPSGARGDSVLIEQIPR